MKATFIFAMLLAVSVNGQQISGVKPFHEPGETLHFEVSFSGPGATDVASVSLHLSISSRVSADQEGFDTQFNGGKSEKLTTPPNTFALSFKIPDSTATGDYQLTIYGNVVGRVLTYESPRDFDVGPIKIHNPRHFPKPNISVKELP